MIPATIPAACVLPAMSAAAVDKVRQLEAAQWNAPHAPLKTHHVLHGGVYARTIWLPAGAVITGALIKVPTTLTISGDVTVFIGDETIKLAGYNVIPASARRKQAFVAHTDAHMTMSFATSARTVQEAEREFTDEAHLLLSRRQPEHDVVIITGEQACRE
jgi:hypothetical protein